MYIDVDDFCELYLNIIHGLKCITYKIISNTHD